MKRVLVSGGAGFIGSNLCSRLVKEECHVICLDNFFTGSIRNIKNLLGLPNFEVVEHDVTTPFFREVDEIYNMACPASPIHYQYDPVHTIKTCVLGAINMLELAIKTDAKILQASTSEVYGDPYIHPQPESYWGNVNPVGIRSCYDEGKRCAETLFMDYHREFGIPIKIIRIFNTYGPNMLPDDGRVITNFVVQAMTGKDITIYGNGLQTRSFQYIDDLIEGVVRVMKTEDSFIGPINLGNPREFTIDELAKLVVDITDTESKIVYSTLPSDDPQQRQPDISLAIEKLNWRPKVHLEQGLQVMVDYFKDRLKEDDLLEEIAGAHKT